MSIKKEKNQSNQTEADKENKAKLRRSFRKALIYAVTVIVVVAAIITVIAIFL